MTTEPNTIHIKDLGKIAVGLNIEGPKPSLVLPQGCEWFNIIQVIDEPLKGFNFDSVMKIVNDNKYQYIEQAVGIDIDKFVDRLVNLINRIKKDYNNVLVHVHQYTGTTILDKTIETKTNVKTILDETNFFESPINYEKKYPTIDCLISISQCAGFDNIAGTWIVPDGFMEFDVKKNTIYKNKVYTKNLIEKYLELDFQFVKGNILVVNDLWNPNLEDDAQSLIKFI